jgi:hypothetical protein
LKVLSADERMRRPTLPRRAAPWLALAVGAVSAAFAVWFAGTRPGPESVPPADADLQRKLEGLADATPEAASSLESKVSSALARLCGTGDFDARIGTLYGGWTVLAQSEDSLPGLETRHYALACDHPRLRAWPDIVRTVGALCDQPGVTVDSLSLESGPEGDGDFSEAQITLTVRLRP